MQIKNSRYCIITRCGYKVLSCSFPFWHESSSVPAYPITAFLILRSLCSSWFPSREQLRCCDELIHRLTCVAGAISFPPPPTRWLVGNDHIRRRPRWSKMHQRSEYDSKPGDFGHGSRFRFGLKWCFLKPPISRVQHPSFEEYPMWFHVYSFFYALAEVSKLAKVLERMAIGPETEGDHIETYSGLWHGAHWGLGHMKQRE